MSNTKTSYTPERVNPAKKLRVIVEPGTRFGEATYQSEAGYIGRNRRMVNCSCSCGGSFVTYLAGLRSGEVTSCPTCAAKRVWDNTRTHGGSHSPEYRAWWAMIRRCYDPNATGFHLWGGRGIKVCDRWRHSFANFLADVGPRPEGTVRHTLDRIDNDRDYEPGNVRWATFPEQARNTRRTVMIEHDGRRACLTDWAESLGISATTLKARIRRLGTERALSTPSARKPA